MIRRSKHTPLTRSAEFPGIEKAPNLCWGQDCRTILNNPMNLYHDSNMELRPYQGHALTNRAIYRSMSYNYRD